MDLRVSEFDHDGQRGFIGILRDITGRMEAESKIFHQAHFDTLTDLPNRNLVQDRIGQAVAAEQRTHTEFAVMYLDLDQFKSINDRLGDDEFIVLVAHPAGVNDARDVAQRLLDALAQPMRIERYNLIVSASIGIALYPHDATYPGNLLKCADTAMYYAKAAGRNNYQFFDVAQTGK